MKRCFSGFESLLLIFSLSMVCLVSPAKGMPHYKTIFNKNILFLSSEHELNSNIYSPDRVVKTVYIKVRQVYCNFLLKVFEKSEVNFSLVFIILISVWSYRRYILRKYDKQGNFLLFSFPGDKTFRMKTVGILGGLDFLGCDITLKFLAEIIL